MIVACFIWIGVSCGVAEEFFTKRVARPRKDATIEQILEDVQTRSEKALVGKPFEEITSAAERAGKEIYLSYNDKLAEIELEENCGPQIFGKRGRLLLLLRKGEKKEVRAAHGSLRYPCSGEISERQKFQLELNKAGLLGRVFAFNDLVQNLKEKPFLLELDVTFGALHEPGEFEIAKGFAFRFEIAGDATSPDRLALEYRVASGRYPILDYGGKQMRPATRRPYRNDAFPSIKRIEEANGDKLFWRTY